MEKIKQFLGSDKGKDIMIVLIVILVGLGSFELGRFSKSNDNAGIKIEYPDQSTNVLSSIPNTPQIAQTNATGKNYFGSSKGKKYYTLGCSAGKTLKMENRIYFATADEAEKAGYTLSSSCSY